MNHLYLMQHVSYHLHTIVRQLTPAMEETKKYCARYSFEDRKIISPVLHYFEDEIRQGSFPDTPRMLTVNGLLAYVLVPCPGFCYLVGPVRFTEPVYYRFAIHCDIPENKWLDTVSFCEPDELFAEILLLYNLYRDKVLDREEFKCANCIPENAEEEVRQQYTSIVFEHQEYQKAHNPYDQEIREQTSIETGDIESLKRSLEEDYTGELGILAKDKLRHMKNTGIVVITLASRSAIRGGVLPETAFSLSDAYIQKLETCRDVATALHLTRECEFHYTRLVKEILDQKADYEKEKNPHIEKCKDFIFKHMHGRITVQEIAAHLGLNANYLSELFRKCEGTTLNQYILKEKLKLVKNLLIYSPYSYIEIASYLGFSSQSYLGVQFKKNTGYTLRQYREKFGAKEFEQGQ